MSDDWLTNVLVPSRVAPGLFVGPLPTARPSFQRIVCLHPWEKYEVLDGAIKVDVRMYDDSRRPPDGAVVDELARLVLRWREQGHDVLVHCYAGLNRSGLVAAASLMRCGASAELAISAVRAARGPEALSNAAFVRFLDGYGPWSP